MGTAVKRGLKRPQIQAFVRLGLELVVVFIGVYAAFLLAERQRQRDAEMRRVQLQVAVVREIQDVIVNTGRVAEWIPPMLASFDSLVAAGGRPPLQPMIEPVRVDVHMWEAVLQSGGLELFDVPTVYTLSQFYNLLNAGFEQLSQLRALSETVLLPNLGQGEDEFYDPVSGALRPKYAWYREGLERLGVLSERITRLGERLVVELTPATGDRQNTAP